MLAQEVVWAFYVAVIVLILPLVVRLRRVGRPPRGACLFCVTHVGGLDVLFVTHAARRWRIRAVYSCDDRPWWLGFLFQAVWRFPVTADRGRKACLNRHTEEGVVQHLRAGGSVMVFPEGQRYWERRLYPGAARMAYRAGVPIVLVGVGNAYLYRPGTEAEPVGRAMVRLVRETRRKKAVEVHFGPALCPQPARPEAEEVDRLMRAIERWFGEFYRRSYGMEGPTWGGRSSRRTGEVSPGGGPEAACDHPAAARIVGDGWGSR